MPQFWSCKGVFTHIVTLCCLLLTAIIPSHALAKADDKAELPIDDVRTFVDIWDRIKKAYVEEVDDQTLLENAIRGMLSELDPHSAYLEPEAFEDLQISTTGEFGGLGIEVGMENGFVKVVTPIDDTPAQRAGVMAGDLIIKLDDSSVKGMTLSDAVALMRGEPGSPIMLTIIREGASKPLEIKVIRDVIQVRSVKSKLLEKNYGYVRITQFQVHTGLDLESAIQKLIKQNETSLEGIVVDLRNNPGGVLQAAVDVADIFMDQGLVVYTKGRLPNSEVHFNATAGNEIDTNLVVLVNGGSASASEIVAGALQDHKRAIIMGTPTFGKGSVQTVLPLNNDRALKLTTARYYTPNGTSIQAQGITPDIQVDVAKITRTETNNSFYREADLRGHLENKNDTSEKKSKKSKDEEKPLAERDYQLYEAVNLLKALKVVQR